MRRPPPWNGSTPTIELSDDATANGGHLPRALILFGFSRVEAPDAEPPRSGSLDLTIFEELVDLCVDDQTHRLIGVTTAGRAVRAVREG